MGHVNTFEELEVYIRARRLSGRIYELTKSFPLEEKYSLTDQIRRSSRSIGAQIAEAWAKRKYIRHFESKLTDADGEQHETRHWILSALDSQLLTREVSDELLEQCKVVGRQLQAMINKSDDFCS
ncbi:MAG: four helix bundle protein [Cyclobacteriaceae bacterium]|nr:four helix bundle protein [Cyclobacteriaceae bacterium]